MAQSIAPPIAEYRGSKVEGMFEIANTADYPMAVILATHSFAVDEHGKVQYRPLDKGIQIKMGASSFVLKSHDSRMIFYKASFPNSPTSFSIFTTMTKAGQLEGVRTNYILPHMIYVYQKEKLNKADVKVEVSGDVLCIHNLSQKLGRVEFIRTADGELGGFPLYPGQTREVQTVSNKISVRFEDGFKVDLE